METNVRRGIKVRVVRAGQSLPVRKTCGLMFGSDKVVADVLAKALQFGKPELPELTVSNALESLQSGGVDITLSRNFQPASEVVIEDANCDVIEALDTWYITCMCKSDNLFLPGEDINRR